MGRLSEPIDKLFAESGSEFDVLVVGSGYGGAVAALRFAEANFRVCVFERGNEYEPGDFPRDMSETPRHFRVDTGGASPSGYDDALFDLHVGDETAVLVGNALGGGSQINANVALEPEAWIFTQTEWPNGIRNTADPLKEWFKKAETILASQKFEKMSV